MAKAKKKVETKNNEETFDEKLASVTFDDKTIADCYEGLVVLSIKLDKLIEIMDKVADYTEAKKNGTLGIK